VAQEKGEGVRRRLLAAENALANERATVDRWLEFHAEERVRAARTRREEYRNPPRYEGGGDRAPPDDGVGGRPLR